MSQQDTARGLTPFRITDTSLLVMARGLTPLRLTDTSSQDMSRGLTPFFWTCVASSGQSRILPTLEDMQETRSEAASAVRRLTPFALFAVSLALLAAPGSTGATKPAWGTMGGIAMATHETTVFAQHGRGERIGSTMIDQRYYGPVRVTFVGHVVRSLLCATPELQGRGCPPGFVLPDGVSLGTSVPEHATRWHGYARADAHPSPSAVWNKTVPLRGANHIDAFISLYKDKVVAIGESINPDSLQMTP